MIVDGAGGGIVDAGNAAPDGGLARAGLTDDSKRLTLLEVEADPVDRLGRVGDPLQETLPFVEMQPQIVDAEDIGGARLGPDLGIGRLLQPLDRAQEFLGVGMGLMRKQRPRLAALHHIPAFHHDHVVRDFGHHPHVVGDEHDRHAEFALELAHEIQDLGLGRDVERRGGLVRDQDVGMAGQRHSDHRPLAHAAGKLEGVLVERGLGLRDLDLLQHLARQLPRFRLGDVAMQADGLDDLVTDGVHGRK